MIRANLVVVVACACGGPSVPVLHTSVAGKVPLAERARLVDAVVDGDSIICITYRGNLVRYDATLRFAGDAVFADSIASISSSLLAVDTNGEVSRIDKPLATRSIELVEGGRWATTWGDKTIVWMDREEQFSVAILEDQMLPVPFDRAMTHDVGRPDTFFLDGDALWWGIHAGEWGGAVGKVMLKTGATSVVPQGPVRGFVRVRHRMFVYGGLAHLDIRRSFIAALDGDAPRTVWEMPRGPLTQMLAHGERLFGVVETSLYEVSADFQRWTKRADLPSHAVALRALGETIVIATTSDGLFVWRDDRLTRIAP